MDKNCSKTQERLSAYLDQQLPLREMQEIDRHLHDCGACFDQWGQLKKLRGIMKSSPVLTPPESFL